MSFFIMKSVNQFKITTPNADRDKWKAVRVFVHEIMHLLHPKMGPLPFFSVSRIFFIRDSEINIEYFYVSSFLPVSCTRKCTLYNVQYTLLYLYRAGHATIF